MKPCCTCRLGVATLAGAALLLAAVTSVTAAPLAAGGCETTASKYKVSAAFQSTTSTTFVDVMETAINFQQGGSGCVIVSFAGMASANPNTLMYVRARLDGATDCLPNDNAFAGSGATASPSADRAMNYVCGKVAPGSHVIKMQFRTGSGPTVSLRSRTIIVHYVK
jgi:hypothetical protein